MITTGGTASAAGLLQSQTLRDALGALRRQAEYVVIEAPATSTSADAQSVASLADIALVAVELKRTRYVDVTDAAEQLRRVGTPLLGAVVLPRLVRHRDEPPPAPVDPHDPDDADDSASPCSTRTSTKTTTSTRPRRAGRRRGPRPDGRRRRHGRHEEDRCPEEAAQGRPATNIVRRRGDRSARARLVPGTEARNRRLNRRPGRGRLVTWIIIGYPVWWALGLGVLIFLAWRR